MGINLDCTRTFPDSRTRKHPWNRPIALLMLISFCLNTILPVSYAQITPLGIPAPGTMLATTSAFSPVLIRGVALNPQDQLQLDFIVDTGETKFTDEALSKESTRMIKYFLASLTIPEEEMWVNLSPYEKDRIIPETFGSTEMGKDLLAQDYLLKQLTASLMYPEKETGKKFWEQIYAAAREKFGTSQVPTDTFNKVWITPNKAVIYEKDGQALVVESRLKVMLESDYLSASNTPRQPSGDTGMQALSDSILRQVVIPVLEKEINEGETFAGLRQIYHAVILAAWFKNNLKESLLNATYTNKNKIDGVAADDRKVSQRIYQQYLQAFQQGAYNYIKEDFDAARQETVPRKYFSGGVSGFEQMQRTVITDPAMLTAGQQKAAASGDKKVGVRLEIIDKTDETHESMHILPDAWMLSVIQSNFDKHAFHQSALLQRLQALRPSITPRALTRKLRKLHQQSRIESMGENHWKLTDNSMTAAEKQVLEKKFYAEVVRTTAEIIRKGEPFSAQEVLQTLPRLGTWQMQGKGLLDVQDILLSMTGGEKRELSFVGKEFHPADTQSKDNAESTSIATIQESLRKLNENRQQIMLKKKRVTGFTSALQNHAISAWDVYTVLDKIHAATTNPTFDSILVFSKYWRLFNAKGYASVLQSDLLRIMAEISGNVFIKKSSRAILNNPESIYDPTKAVDIGIRRSFLKNDSDELAGLARKFSQWTVKAQQALVDLQPNARGEISIIDVLSPTWGRVNVDQAQHVIMSDLDSAIIAVTARLKTSEAAWVFEKLAQKHDIEQLVISQKAISDIEAAFANKIDGPRDLDDVKHMFQESSKWSFFYRSTWHPRERRQALTLIIREKFEALIARDVQLFLDFITQNDDFNTGILLNDLANTLNTNRYQSMLQSEPGEDLLKSIAKKADLAPDDMLGWMINLLRHADRKTIQKAIITRQEKLWHARRMSTIPELDKALFDFRKQAAWNDYANALMTAMASGDLNNIAYLNHYLRESALLSPEQALNYDLVADFARKKGMKDIISAKSASFKEAFPLTPPDNAELGGINLKAQEGRMRVIKEGAGMTMNADPRVAEQLLRGDFTGIIPVIIQTTQLNAT